MNSIVEIHDSVLASICPRGGDLVLRLASAYVHRSAGRPGIDPGSGWTQVLDLVISEATVESLPADLPAELSDGAFAAGEARWDNAIPLPLGVEGAVSLTALTNQGERLAVRGTGAAVVMCGESRYIEEFPGSAGT
jgi:hypothetical protein